VSKDFISSTVNVVLIGKAKHDSRQIINLEGSFLCKLHAIHSLDIIILRIIADLLVIARHLEGPLHLMT
jgi:hypothetical protein